MQANQGISHLVPDKMGRHARHVPQPAVRHVSLLPIPVLIMMTYERIKWNSCSSRCSRLVHPHVHAAREASAPQPSSRRG